MVPKINVQTGNTYIHLYNKYIVHIIYVYTVYILCDNILTNKRDKRHNANTW